MIALRLGRTGCSPAVQDAGHSTIVHCTFERPRVTQSRKGKWNLCGSAALRAVMAMASAVASCLRAHLAQVALDRQVGRARGVVAVQDAERGLLVERVAVARLERPEVQVPQEHI